ncbi:MAG: DUF4159 domain-containing protein [Alphaproteobacteria bacterium]|nr:DUF4159 domain-containing protein [Alphaproteobacteria bacterium]
MGSLVFSAPLLLSALIMLPGLWWLLRLLPPQAQKILYPPLEIIIGARPDQSEPRRTPLWILLLRLALAAFLIIAMAGPKLVSQKLTFSGTSPLLIILDDGWSSAHDWNNRVDFVKSLIDEADETQRPIALVATSQSVSTIEPLAALDARRKLASLSPVAFATSWQMQERKIVEFLSRFPDAQIVLLPEAAKISNDTTSPSKVFADKNITIVSSVSERIAFAGSKQDAKGLTLHLTRLSKGQDHVGRIIAYDAQAQLIGDAAFHFSAHDQETNAIISLPTELLNRITRVAIEGERSAGATWLIGTDGQRARVGLVGSSEGETKNRLADPSWYIKQALAPFVDLFNPRMGQSEAIASLIEAKVDAIILGDTNSPSPEALKALSAYIDAGGTLIRFAGSTAQKNDDPLWPVRLRADGRALGGALDWQSPRPLAPFVAPSPFVGLDIPADVTIRRQWLAEPDSDLNNRIWAKLDDGTPLVTAAKKGQGRIILFHVASDPTWSTLPVSGLFVEMLKRMATRSALTQNLNGETQNTPQAPLVSLDGYGVLGAPSLDAEPLTLGTLPRANNKHPAGLYGAKEANTALNVLSDGDHLALPDVPLAASKTSLSLGASQTLALTPYCLFLGLLLFLIDTFVSLGLLRSNAIKTVSQTGAVLVFALTISVSGVSEARSEAALSPKDREGALATRLAYVITGDTTLDETSREGLQGLSLFLQDHTAIEPDDPVGVDLDADSLALYPLIYWPMPPQGQTPSASALARLETYMRNGGLVVFDTRDAASNNGTNGTAETAFLQSLLAGLSLPPLEEIPTNHVVMRSFYLLQTLPGRYAQGKTWVEALPPDNGKDDAPARASDNVSPLVITSNDWASAWAIDRSGRALYPIEASMPRQREMALRAGVNLVVYALTGNYKADQIHVPALLERLGR